VAGCCECGDEPSGSCATELLPYIFRTSSYDSSVIATELQYFALRRLSWHDKAGGNH
jgi:hypothetical protein